MKCISRPQYGILSLAAQTPGHAEPDHPEIAPLLAQGQLVDVGACMCCRRPLYATTAHGRTAMQCFELVTQSQGGVS